MITKYNIAGSFSESNMLGMFSESNMLGMFSESNITNDERTYRNFVNIVNFRCPNADTTDIKVDRTPKGNWNVYDKDGNKLCLVSRSILSDEMVDARNMRCKCD